jgi:hypothetical protein
MSRFDNGVTGAGAPTLVVVCAHRQRARTGLKAFVLFPAAQKISAAWFPGWWPSIGSRAVVSGRLWNDIWATHHGEVVFWVEHVHAVADADVLRRSGREQRRLNRRQRRT